MLLFLAAFVLLVGSWFWFGYNTKNGTSNVLLVVVMICSPFLLFIGGISYAANIHNQGAAFAAAGLGYLLLFNSFILIIVIAILTIKNKRKSS
ncbi:hypothetical protein [Halobacillus hunanensis]|uniref:hypothetical protein n=1 Tax=Halobacillus hunanensis TaxID=578214 RepID=UPI0009A844F5|nr:hypothetical protein [Halobacillus hunanensis]